MIRQGVNSSMIRAIGFDGEAMEIEFPNGRVYRYTGPKVFQHYQDLMTSDSIGKHFSRHVRTCPETVCEPVTDVPA